MAVNCGKKKASTDDGYHHGDLRRTLIRAGIKMLKSNGVAGLSMRKLAREAGVSHNAPYMHFADKQAIVAALAEEGFLQLSSAIRKAHAKHPDNWRDQLFSGSVAYVQYAKQNKSLMEIMFQEHDGDLFPELRDASKAALHLLSGLIERGQEAGELTEGDATEYAVCIWAMLHGVATILAGRKGPGEVLQKSPEDTTECHLRLLLNGLRK